MFKYFKVKRLHFNSEKILLLTCIIFQNFVFQFFENLKPYFIKCQKSFREFSEILTELCKIYSKLTLKLQSLRISMVVN